MTKGVSQCIWLSPLASFDKRSPFRDESRGCVGAEDKKKLKRYRGLKKMKKKTFQRGEPRVCRCRGLNQGWRQRDFSPRHKCCQVVFIKMNVSMGKVDILSSSSNECYMCCVSFVVLVLWLFIESLTLCFFIESLTLWL